MLTLRINDQVRQQDNTGNMHYKIGDQIEYISKYITLNPGDLLLTGTPHGIGQIKVGDKIKADIKQNEKTLVEMKFAVVEDDCLAKH